MLRWGSKIDNPEQEQVEPISTEIILNGRVLINLYDMSTDAYGTVSLNDVYKYVEGIAKENHMRILTILAIYELGLHGYVYRYGNHGDYWELIGETCGYA